MSFPSLPNRLTQRFAGYIAGIRADNLRIRKIEDVGCRMDWVVLQRREHVKTRSFRAEREAPRAREQVNRNRSARCRRIG